MLALIPLRPMSKSLRVLAALLTYPDAQMRDHLCEMRTLLVDEDAATPSRRAAPGRSASAGSQCPPNCIQMRYFPCRFSSTCERSWLTTRTPSRVRAASSSTR